MTTFAAPRLAMPSIWHPLSTLRPHSNNLRSAFSLLGGCQRRQSSLKKSNHGYDTRIAENIRSETRFHRPRPLHRSFSTSRQSKAWWHLLGRGNESRGKKLPPLASFLDGSAPRLVLKATNEPRLRCTEFDENGNVTLVNGEFKKSELIQMVRHMQDL
jgi:hypothetical protein